MSEKIELPATGERYLPGMGGRIAAEHLVRYAFASQYVKGRSVLDIASGEGYGAAIMGLSARSVCGVDVADDAVQFATSKYHTTSNVTFLVGDVTELSFSDHQFDVVTCFETIEHVKNPLNAVAELSRVLNDDGLLFISTPNKSIYTERFGYKNPYHEHEMEFEEFQAALRKHFKYVKFFGQHSGAASIIHEVDASGLYHLANLDECVTHANIPKWASQPEGLAVEPLYFLAVCSQRNFQSPTSPTEIFDLGDWRATEDEFLLREIRSAQDTDKMLIDKLIEQIDSANSLRRQLSVAKYALIKLDEKVRSEPAQASEAVTNAFKSMQKEYANLATELEKLKMIENSTTWKTTKKLRDFATRMPFLRKFLRTFFSRG